MDLTTYDDCGKCPFCSNIFPLGHQIRDFESSMMHVPRRAAKVLTVPMHPAPYFMPFTSWIFCANAEVLRTTSAAVRAICIMTGTSEMGEYRRWCSARRYTMGECQPSV